MTGNFSKYVPPLFSVVVLQESLRMLSPKVSDELFFKIGKSLGRLLSTNFKNFDANIKQMELIKLCLREIAYLGFGESEVSVFNPAKNQIIIKNLTNPWAKQYKKTFGRPSENIDFFIAGIYSGIFSAALDIDCFFEERLCISSGNSYCAFHSTPESMKSKNYFYQGTIDLRLSGKNLITQEINVYPNYLIQKMFSLNHITLSKGELKVWTIYCIMLPFDLYQIIFEFLLEYIETKDILMYLGMIQSKIGVQFQVNKFGIEKGDATFNSILQQLELLGLGKGEVILRNNDNLEVEFKNYNPLMQHKQMFSDNDLHPYYTVGLLLGMAKYSYDKNIESYSVSTNKGLNVRIIFAKNEEDFFFSSIQESIPSKIKDIIEEKMKHQYYLN